MAMDIETWRALGLDRAPPRALNGRDGSEFPASLDHPADRVYHPCPEAWPREGVVEGEVRVHRDWNGGGVYPETVRDLFVYRTPGLDPTKAARLVVFNAGVAYLSRKGPVRAGRVLDSLFATGEIAATVAVFLNPGRPPTAAPGSPEAIHQRMIEYDTLTPAFGAYLVESVLPFVESAEGLRLTDDPAHRTVCGISSGGICAFNAAWHFPDQFGRVLSHCGSFTNIRGGHNYSYLVRGTERKPIRVLLQSGEQDLVSSYGDWPLANREMANALAFAGYDVRFEFGVGGHTLRQGGAIFADSLRWLWRET